MAIDPRDYEKNTSAQYEALGRFVEAFEAMVNEARENAIQLIERDPHHGRLVAIALHHSSTHFS
jgi:outer membrane protein assembly factor BamD (BamD/ComL family)